MNYLYLYLHTLTLGLSGKGLFALQLFIALKSLLDPELICPIVV